MVNTILHLKINLNLIPSRRSLRKMRAGQEAVRRERRSSFLARVVG
jgi:hypothetical protein